MFLAPMALTRRKRTRARQTLAGRLLWLIGQQIRWLWQMHIPFHPPLKGAFKDD